MQLPARLHPRVQTHGRRRRSSGRRRCSPVKNASFPVHLASILHAGRLRLSPAVVFPRHSGVICWITASAPRSPHAGHHHASRNRAQTQGRGRPRSWRSRRRRPQAAHRQTHRRRRRPRQLEPAPRPQEPARAPDSLPARALLWPVRGVHVFRRDRQRFLRRAGLVPRGRQCPQHQRVAPDSAASAALAQHPAAFAQLHHHRNRTPPHVPRGPRHGRVARAGQALERARQTLDRRDDGARNAFSSSASSSPGASSACSAST